MQTFFSRENAVPAFIDLDKISVYQKSMNKSMMRTIEGVRSDPMRYI